MTRMIRPFLFPLLIAILLTVSAGAATVGKAPGMPAEAKRLLEKVTRLDREISRTLGRMMQSGKLPEKPNRPGVRPYDGYRAHLNQLRIQASHLDRPAQAKLRRAIRAAWRKTELLRREEKNQKLFAADKRRAMKRRGLAPDKTYKKMAPLAAEAPAAAPPNDNCANATPVNEGTFFGSTDGATNDGSEDCVGDPSEDIWYAYTATVTSLIKVDTLGSNYDTVLSVHTPPCPGTVSNEIVCNDDCAGLESCVTFNAVMGNTYLIRVGGFTGDTGSVQLNIGVAGAISGTVTASENSQPIQDSEVDIYDSQGNVAAYAYTDGSGQYTSGALSAGTYFVLTYGDGLHLGELYDNIPCPHGSCDPLTGTPVTVNAGGTTAGINFVLDPGGSVAGKITDETNNQPIPYEGVEIFDENGSYSGYGYTDASGNYTIGGLTTGTYFARTSDYGDYQNELYDNIPCPGYCDPTTGTPISVTQGQTTPGINFALARLGHISGRVTNDATGAGIPNIYIDIYDQNGNWRSYGYTDTQGNYTAKRLVTGNYFALTESGNSGYLDELYDNISCPHGNCDPTTGTAIPVVSGGTTSGINFALAQGGTIVGRVLAAGGHPIEGASVTIFDVNADAASEAYTDQSGYYAARGLITGTYYAYVDAGGFFGQVYNGLPCPNLSCSPTAGTPIAVTMPQIVTNINFTLNPGGSIQGEITDSLSHQPIPYQGVDIYDSSGNWTAYGYSDANGKYVAGGLLTGNYFAEVSTYGEYLGELYDNIPCPQGNCDVLTGTPIPVTVSQDTLNINFALDLGGSISGTLTDAATSAPLQYYGVDVYNSTGNFESYGYTDSTGNYVVAGLSGGNHFAATSTYGDYVDELYNNIPCPYYSCDPTTGTPIPVTVRQNTPGIDFALDRGGSISGTITDSITALPLSDAWISVYDSNGNYMNYGYTDAAGHYSVPGLATGSYFAIAGSDYHLTELYNDHPCGFYLCSVTSGDPIPVIVNQDTGGIDFALVLGASISGTIIDAATQQPLQDVYVVVQDSSGNSSYSYSDASGHYTVTGLTAGTYYVRASEYGYTAQLYQDIPCPDFSCDPTTGTPVTVNDSADTPGIDFAMQLQPPTGTIHGTITRDSDSLPLQSVFVEIYDAAGSYTGYTYTDSTGAYSTWGLSPGTYYVAASRSGYRSEIYNNIPCPDLSCDVLTGTPVTVNPGAQTNGIDFALTAGAAVRGVVWDAQSGKALAGVLMKVLTSAGNVVSTGYTDDRGKYTIGELADGSYYVMAAESAGYVDQLYNGVPCPDGACALSAGTLIPVATGGTASGINFPMAADTCVYCDDFEDGQLPNWTYLKPAWSETGGSLVGTPSGKKAMAVATPAFQGCSVCAIDTTLQISGGAQSKVWLMGWYSGKSAIELLMKGDKDRWILKEKVQGSMVQKAKGVKAIDPDTPYRVHMVFDGVQLKVFVDDMVNPLITMTPKAPPSGSIGLAVKGTTASFDYLDVN